MNPGRNVFSSHMVQSCSVMHVPVLAAPGCNGLIWSTQVMLAFPQVNDTVLTDVQGGQIASASDISPGYPSQRSISLPAGNT